VKKYEHLQGEEYKMEKLEQQKKLQSLKTQLQQIINLYNELSAEEKIGLTVTNNNQNNKKAESTKIDVSKYLICSYGTRVIWVGNFFFGEPQYDFDSVGLFEKIHDGYDKEEYRLGNYFLGCSEPPKRYNVRIDRQVYFDINSDQVAIFESSSDGLEAKKIGYTTTLSDGRKVAATCVIGKAYSFDSMRLKLYQNGDIGPYEIGKATNEEILEVLVHAQKMFGEENAKQHQRQHKRN